MHNGVKFTVGQWVHVARTVEAGYPWMPRRSGTGGLVHSRRRQLWVHEAGWPAIVVGATRIKLGVRTEGSPGTGWGIGGDYDPGEPPTFKVTRTVLAYLVRQGMTNKAHRCLTQHLTPIDTKLLPWFHNSDPGANRRASRWGTEVQSRAVEKALGGACKYCNNVGYLQPWQAPPNAPKPTTSKPCPGCNPRGVWL